ncbi:MATE family efflux transporter [Colwellia echini]|uniref:MATE family efflux transporter n=1 Tax=Colwellia echini TaxID=1982103 RepID=A0ABY3N0F9_9GAMM|nr:MATE family efflux transporter [Colwellia echini]TYK66973.1 MATE family efflux transporter [Colwellia echini]
MNAEQLRSIYLRKNLSLAWPLAFNALLMQSMLIIDLLLISPLGEVSLAAMGIATTIIAFFLGLQIALANGTQLIVGRIFGAKDKARLQKAFGSGLFISVSAALIFILLLVLWSDNLTGLLTQDPFIAEQIHNYLSVAQYILLFNAITQTITVYLNGQGNTKTSLQVYLIEVPFNALMSYLLIFGVDNVSMGLGVVGAAYGSLAAVLLRLILLFSYVLKQKVLPEVKRKTYLDVTAIKAHFTEIMPIAANFLVLSVGNTVYQLLFSQLNIYSYVAITLVFPWLRIATQLIVAWAQASAISITQAIGQGNINHIKPIIDSCLKLGAVLACLVALCLYGFSLSVELIYPKVEQQTLIALASITPLYVLLPLIRTYNTISGNCLRAMGKSMQVLNIHFVTQWVIVLPLASYFILVAELPLFWAFALLPLEELLKSVPFHYMLKNYRI